MADNNIIYSMFVLLLWVLAYDITLAQTSRGQQEIVVQPKDTNAIRGELATFYCTIANLVGVPSWSKDGVIIAVKPTDAMGDAGDQRWAIFGNETAGEFNLQIVTVDDSDAGMYTCNISEPTSTSGSTSSGYLSSQPAALHVLPPPDGDFPECLISIEGTLEVGEAVEFTCAFRTENPRAQLYWTKQDDDSFMPTSPETHVREGFIVTQFYHSITRDDHLSTFQCIVESSDLPSARSCTTGFIVVRHVPDVMITPASPSVRRGDPVNFTCLIKSSYPADFTYSWTYKGQPLEEFGSKIVAEGTKLSINDVEDDDNDAVVACEAVNDVGSNRATAVIKLTQTTQNNIYTWVIPIAIIVAIIFIILIILSVVFECKCCCRRYVRTKKLNASGWSAEQFVMETRLQAPERRNSDATTDFFIARDITTPASRATSRGQQQRNQRDDMSYIQETAIDNVNQGRPNSQQQRHYGSFGVEQRQQQPRNTTATRPYQNSGSKLGYTEVDAPSPDRNVSPGFSDSGLDYQSSFDESRSPTPKIDSTPPYAQVRRSGRPSRIGGPRLSVQERQHIMDEL